MEQQNFRNHTRYLTIWHFIVPVLIAGLLGWGIVLFMDHHKETHFLGASMLLTSIILVFIYWYARVFALKAQDRAIRAEENFRHFILTGKPFPKELRLRQIIALRFAGDEEFPSLVQRAISENLSSKQIKQEIKHWKADHNRV